MAANRKRPSSKKKPIEQYEHPDKKRLNNPPVGLVTPDTEPTEVESENYAYDPHIDPALQFDSKRSEVEKIIDDGLEAKTIEEAKAALTELKKRQQPYLNWAGKAEHTSFEVPTVSLHVHERIDPRTIIEAVRTKNGRPVQPSLFEQPQENPPLRDAIDFYKHKHGWSNRLIAGDSLLVMNSLLEKEGMAGQVQMVYIDPPYGIKYGSNFQPFVNKRDVKDGKDEDLTQEPEMVRAFRDTWELGIHSYLTYLRDRLLLGRELLNESGSCFVQISDENVHRVRDLLDEVFGSQNFVCQIAVQKTGGLVQMFLPRTYDVLLWYARDKTSAKYRRLYLGRSAEPADYQYLELDDGTRRALTLAERQGYSGLPNNARLFSTTSLESANPMFPFKFDGTTYEQRWKTNEEGLKRLQYARRLSAEGKTLRYVRFYEDFPVKSLQDVWADTMGERDIVYVVQTNTKILSRCILMTTDPGDLVLDPTCGSGTTAYVAEQWGRRWITCDTSRVALTLAKQRLMTAVYDYYELAYPEEGVGSGFKYKTVPHVTLKSIANNPEIRVGMTRSQIDAAIAKYAEQETLYDQPYVDKGRARVSGPFTVEAVPAPTVRSLEEIEVDTAAADMPADASIARYGPTLRHSEWRDELLKTGIRGKGGQKIEFSRVEPLAGTRWLHADAETKGAKPERVVISFGPAYAPLEQRQVELAWEEARTLMPRPSIIVFAAFEFDPEAAKDIDKLTNEKTRMTFLTAKMNGDLLTEDLKKKRSSNQSFWLVGRPDVEVRQVKSGEHKGKLQVEVLGFDYFNTRTGVIESGDASEIAMWLLDTDYDGRSLYPRQVFFPMAADDEGWARLAKNLKAEIDPDLIATYRGTVSLPFEPGKNRRVAVKVVDDRGIESLTIADTK
jgi:adenine-specific DNA-methyltransferase